MSSSSLASSGSSITRNKFYLFLSNYIPFLRWVPIYPYRTSLVGDIIAGLTVTAVAAPEAVSYAAIAGLPAAQGLYTGFLGPLAYSLTGSSPQLIVGPTAIMCILTNNAIPTVWDNKPVELPNAKDPSELRVQLAGMLSLTVAILQLCFALFRLSGFVTLISTPIIAGFTTGSALLTASSQFSSLLGMAKCVDSSGASCTFYEALAFIADNHKTINGNVALMSLICLIILIALKFGPKFIEKYVQSSVHRKLLSIVSNLAPLLLVIITVPIVSSIDKQLEKWGLDAPKTIPSGLPNPLWPYNTELTHTTNGVNDYTNLFIAALPLAIIGYMGAVTIAKTAARQNGPYPVDSSQELWGQIACNTACGLGQGIPVTGSFSRTAVNAASGARTGLASLLTAIFMAIALETITGTLSLIPSVVRSTIVIVAIAKMVELHLLLHLWKTDKRDCLVFTVTFMVVIFYSAAAGLATGIILQWLLALTRLVTFPSLINIFGWVPKSTTTNANDMMEVYNTNSSSSSSSSWVHKLHQDNFIWTEIRPPSINSSFIKNSDGNDKKLLANKSTTTIVNPSNKCIVITCSPDLQFSSAERIQEHIEEIIAVYEPSSIILNGTLITSADSTGITMLFETAKDCYKQSHCRVILCNVSSHILHSIFATANLRNAEKGCQIVSESNTVLAEYLLITKDITQAHIQAMEISAKQICLPASITESIDNNNTKSTVVLNVRSMNSSSSSGKNSASLQSPLLNDDDSIEDTTDNPRGSSTPSSSSSTKVPITGVPLAPNVEQIQIYRRSKVPLSSIKDTSSNTSNNNDDDAKDEKHSLDNEWSRILATIHEHDQRYYQHKELTTIEKYMGNMQHTGQSILQTGKNVLVLFDESKPLIVLGPPSNVVA